MKSSPRVHTFRFALFAWIATVAMMTSLALVGTGLAQESDASPEAQPLAAFSTDEALAEITAEDGSLNFEVSEDITRFVCDEAPVDDDGFMTHGNSFITQGYIYPAGTLDGTNGVLADGSPEFPDLVMGEWTCKGWFVGDAMYADGTPAVITTHIYNFGDAYGLATLITEGYELGGVGHQVSRAITGGTGPFATARGQGIQTGLGLNAGEGVVLGFTLQVQDMSAS